MEYIGLKYIGLYGVRMLQSKENLYLLHDLRKDIRAIYSSLNNNGNDNNKNIKEDIITTIALIDEIKVINNDEKILNKLYWCFVQFMHYE